MADRWVIVKDIFMLTIGGVLAVLGLVMIVTGPTWEVRFWGLFIVALYIFAVFLIRWNVQHGRWR